MHYNVLDIAQYIIQKYNEQNICINNLKLQKILYFIQAEFLVATNQPCFCDEIQAWNFGPVIPTVYREYAAFGSTNIPYFKKTDVQYLFHKKDIKLIDDITNQCSKYSSSSLTDITMNQTPWLSAYGQQNNVIAYKDIQRFFASEKDYL